MILSFTQHINGQPNLFIEKIWESICHLPWERGNDYHDFLRAHIAKFGQDWDGTHLSSATYEPVNKKCHTIRQLWKKKDGSISDRQWKAGDLIHPTINNRSPRQFQFAPSFKCQSVQQIAITYQDFNNGIYSVAGWPRSPRIIIDGRVILEHEVVELARNDGFDTVTEFLNYFDEDFTGVLIHWTDLKY